MKPSNSMGYDAIDHLKNDDDAGLGIREVKIIVNQEGRIREKDSGVADDDPDNKPMLVALTVSNSGDELVNSEILYKSRELTHNEIQSLTSRHVKIIDTIDTGNTTAR